MTRPKSLHFGAGNIGRGFIGPLLTESGYHVVFVDVDHNIIDELNQHDSYNVMILDDHESRQSVSSVSGVLSQNDDVIRDLADPSFRLVTTAVGLKVLEKIAYTMAKGLQARREADAGMLTIIACENMVGQTTLLSRYISQHLSSDDQSWVDEQVSFANCSVDRIVPPVELHEHEDNHLDVGVEEFFEWVVDETALKTSIEPKVKGMLLTHNLDGYIERKLFTLNCGHAITAYLGYIKGYRTINHAIQDKEIHTTVRGALDEGGAALIKKHHFDPSDHSQYIDKIMKRIANPKLKDDVARVGRQPLRKLGKFDRLCGPANMARDYGLPIHNLARGIAAAFLYDVKDDEESVELQDKVREVGIEKAVEDITGFEQGSEQHRQIIEAYRVLIRECGTKN